MVKRKSAYVPDRGDLIWLTFDPQAGREQAGRRPAIVLSHIEYNRLTQLAVICPITSQVKGYNFEVVLPEGLPITGVVLSDHIKNMDWQVRQAKYISKAPESVIDEIHARLKALLQIT